MPASAADSLLAWAGMPEALRAEVLSPQCWLCDSPRRLLAPQQMRGHPKLWPLPARLAAQLAPGLRPPPGAMLMSWMELLKERAAWLAAQEAEEGDPAQACHAAEADPVEKEPGEEALRRCARAKHKWLREAQALQRRADAGQALDDAAATKLQRVDQTRA
ncbi:hypothetical protein WJX81_002436 [Elliptochloris bilobata]|uniref:Uncharacterized protein n=1 Tax=Elliptochloris bilobata TaxID=381761 RepID=A0AAW1R2C4_9CHLO